MRALAGSNSVHLAATLGALLATVASAPAQAREPPGLEDSRYPPEPEDFDARAETRSALWEQAAFPNRTRYAQRIDRALDFMKGRDTAGDNAAIEKLEEAIEMAPEEPAAYWLLATIYERREDWPRCVANYARVLNLDPMFEPAQEHMSIRRDARFAVDIGMAICQQRSGHFEAAIDHYKRVLGRGVKGANTQARRLREMLYRRLGESYMALGRLREAIDVLELASRERLRKALTHYSLAVAYDRDEQVAEARKALQTAFSYDHSQTALTATSTWMAPAEDALYYLGLAHATRRETARAIAYFRQYLHVVGTTSWARRARQHLRDLAGESLFGAEDIVIQGPKLDVAKTAAAIQRMREPLMACAATAPGLLLEVRITVLSRAERKSRRKRQKVPRRPIRIAAPGGFALVPATTAKPGVRARELYSFSTTEDQSRAVRQCVESVAEKIAIERPRGDPGTYRRVVFKLIAAPTRAEID